MSTWNKFIQVIDGELNLVRAFNEPCRSDNPSCPEPLQCINGYCLCSNIGKTVDAKNLLSFWTGEECMICPLHYTTSGAKCYTLILGETNQLTWDSARERCQKDGGDLFVIRRSQEFESIALFIRSNIKENEMFQKTPRNGTNFASIWIGAKLADWSGEGKYDLISHGPSITKRNPYWCKQNSPLGQEPNYVALKATGERQTCIGLALFKGTLVCMHDWFCSWKTYTLCEIHPPPPRTTTTIIIDTDMDVDEELLISMTNTNKLNKALWTNITQLKLLNKEGSSVRFLLDKSPFDENDDDETSINNTEYVIIGRILPNSDIFKESAFQIEMKLTSNYPFEPPEVRFLTPIYPPNIDKDGKFCHPLLTKTTRWKHGTTLIDVVKAVVEHIDNPDIDYSVNADIGREYMENRAEFNRKSLGMIQQYKLPRN
ncbi:unnamed protein product [Rotaria sp. Silwood1]|nr:unnamed protein product [Rotaria sp. Silwood1]CAF3726498.1 unnamed protein product [Rotaria sp. Silwood1]CAF4624212.1 unnamed protein product [Rotaria sp. Silwood1]CAF4711981.1 unnamed protein product [Rotaria sp. Silwood1]CAF4755573.1 unnamed protein product [Rotaria sp. Silwood1]